MVRERLIRQGEVLPANSPVVKGRKELFEETKQERSGT
jgi:hypothetical protein